MSNNTHPTKINRLSEGNRKVSNREGSEKTGIQTPEPLEKEKTGI